MLSFGVYIHPKFIYAAFHPPNFAIPTISFQNPHQKNPFDIIFFHSCSLHYIVPSLAYIFVSSITQTVVDLKRKTNI